MQEALEANAGIPDMELVDPTAPGFAQRAAFLLNRDGVRAYCCMSARATELLMDVDLNCIARSTAS